MTHRTLVGRRLRPPIMLLAIVLAAGVPAAVPEAADAALPVLTVTVNCTSNPERTVIKNNRGYAVTIASIGSIYRPRAAEPYAVNYRLAARRSVTFYSGSAASGGARTLTKLFIYDNGVGTREGARVRRSNGVLYTDRCG